MSTGRFPVPKRRAARALAGLALAFVLGPAAAAPAVAVEPALGESVELVRSLRLLPVGEGLETTVFRPAGPGPFPVAVVNHGKAPGNNQQQPRYRPLLLVRELLQRGYAVVLPMRQGFAGSGGSVVGNSCNTAAAGDAQALDLDAVTQWLQQQPWADTQRMVMLGQSHGGLATLAYAQQPHPGYRLFVNFAGGLRGSDANGCDWREGMVQAFRRYGAATRGASLWFYGASDSYFPPALASAAHAAYRSAGGAAQLVSYELPGRDAHGLLNHPEGVSVWLPPLLQALAAAQLPVDVVLPQYASAGKAAVPPPSGFAALHDVERLPHLRDTGRAGYRVFLDKPPPRAFALSAGGAWGWAQGGDDAPGRALANCARVQRGECTLYAVDDAVVWPVPTDAP
ncbi:dienelactone hydrolase family protein [Azohydromonas aeria]|uniref:dienelactone hydrolase family protein n=1 Tax=Azohydromonas aeria TaxID=2590212 RepID=UPI0012F82DC4|nr:CocE/NonD family hydrolase [Azohydromonas aeria]